VVVVGVVGGKGGTGKTFVSVNLAVLASRNKHKTLLVDVDVDNPSTKHYLRLAKARSREVTMFKPIISEKRCKLCFTCINSCPEHALVYIPVDNKIKLLSDLCSGCSVCMYVCPEKAITEGRKTYGTITYAVIDRYLDAVIGELYPGERHTINLMIEVLSSIRDMVRKYDVVVIDSPPGVNAGIYEVVRFSDKLVAVTEPTRLGLNDLKKLVNLILKLGKKPLIILNKHGLKGGIDSEVIGYVEKMGLSLIKVPYSESIALKIMKGEVVVNYSEFTSVLNAFNEILRYVVS